jgi:hypothetical protein
MVPFERTVAPRLDLRVDLLVQLAHRARAEPRAPEGLGDVLDSQHAHSGKIHLHQGFFHRTLSSPITFDDGRLKGQASQLRNLQADLPNFGVQLPLVGSRSRVLPRLGPFVPLGSAKTVGFPP